MAGQSPAGRARPGPGVELAEHLAQLSVYLLEKLRVLGDR
jgi:hypothetical protein